MRPRIYVVHDTGDHDISDATRFGDIQDPIIDDRHRINANGRFMVHRISRYLEGFRDEDYLLLIGDPVGIGVACAAAARHNRGRVNLLKWDGSRYYPIHLDFNRDG